MTFKVTFSTSPSFSTVFTGGKIQAEYFTGPYEYTATPATQTIPIGGKTARSDITIDPIPSNYGLITWNGSVLTVS